MQKILAIVDTINGFPINWKTSYLSLLKIKKIIEEEKISINLDVLIDHNNDSLIPFNEQQHLNSGFIKNKFNQPYFSYHDLLAKYFKEEKINVSDFTDVFYFSGLNCADYQIADLLSNAKITLIDSQNNTQHSLKSWTTEALIEYNIAEWNFLDNDKIVEFFQSCIQKEKYDKILSTSLKNKKEYRI